jgi:hypothetical protein
MGKDKDDLFWIFGNMHGLENIAYVDPKELEATKGNPALVQELLDNAKPTDLPKTFEQQLDLLEEGLASYYEIINSTELAPSDRKKLLSLPFFLAKRTEMPEPKKGMKEYDLFKEMTGHNWDDFKNANFDREEKITEFDFENYFPAGMLKNVDIESKEWRDFVRTLSITSKTEMEKHDHQKKMFSKFMPYLARLNDDEKEIFFHKI